MKYEFETEVADTWSRDVGFRKDFSKLNKIRRIFGLFLTDAMISLPKNIKETLHENDKVKITIEKIEDGESG